jgi:hypothetical protein
LAIFSSDPIPWNSSPLIVQPDQDFLFLGRKNILDIRQDCFSQQGISYLIDPFPDIRGSQFKPPFLSDGLQEAILSLEETVP